MDADTSEVSPARKRRSSRFNPVIVEPSVKPDSVDEYLGIDPGSVVRIGPCQSFPASASSFGTQDALAFSVSEIQSAMPAKKPKPMREVRAELQP